MRDPESEDRDPFRFLVLVACMGALVVLFAILGNLVWFGWNGGSVSTRTDTWGQFGDFVGGVTNPLVAFLGLVALLYTIALQHKELGASRQQLRLSRKELARSAESLGRQNFQSALFALLEARRETLRNLTIHETTSGSADYEAGKPSHHGEDALAHAFKTARTIALADNLPESHRKLRRMSLAPLSSLLMLDKALLEYVRDSSSDAVRKISTLAVLSAFSDVELSLIAYECTFDSEFSELAVAFKIFERSNPYFRMPPELLKLLPRGAFGSNPWWLEGFGEEEAESVG